MSNLLKDLLAELKAQEDGSVDKTAAAPNEAPTVESQNADILETSQAMMAKIDNFLQQVNGMGQDSSQDPNADPSASGAVNPNGASDPNAAAGGSSVHLEVPAGMTVKLASVEPIDSDSALRTIVGLLPSYFEA